MRRGILVSTYGTSPLYSLVAFIFRYRRLFIVSIVLSTLLLTSLAVNRAADYSAAGVVLVTEKSQSVFGSANDARSDSAENRLNLLAVCVKSPTFVRSAVVSAKASQARANAVARGRGPFTTHRVDYHFDARMTDSALDKYARDASQALHIEPHGGVVQVSCRWPTREAEDIVNAVVREYRNEVVQRETTSSSQQEALLTGLLADYSGRKGRIETRLLAYRHNHIADPPEMAADGMPELSRLQTALNEMKLNLVSKQELRDAYALQIKTMAPRIVSSEVIAPATATPAYQAAVQNRNQAQQALDALRAKYLDTHPMVREALEHLKRTETALVSAGNSSRAAPNIQSTTQVVNQDYVKTSAIINQTDAELRALRAGIDTMSRQLETEKARALAAGEQSYDYRSLGDEYDAVAAMCASLLDRLRAVQVARKQDARRTASEIVMTVKPTASREGPTPGTALLILLGPILGTLTATGLSLVIGSFDHALRASTDVERYLAKPVFAMLPELNPEQATHLELGAGDNRGQTALPPP